LKINLKHQGGEDSAGSTDKDGTRGQGVGTIAGARWGDRARGGSRGMGLVVRLVGQKTRDGLVEEGDSAAVSNDNIGVTDLLSNKVVDVSKSLVSITAAEATESPVVLDSGERRVVCVEGGVSGVLGGSGDGTKKNRPDAVSLGVRFVLIKSDKDQSLLQEGLVVQGGVQEVLEPVSSELGSGIVSIVGHVRGIEGPLGNKTSSNVRGELSAGNNVGSASGVKTNGVIDDSRVVLANIGTVVGLEASETNRREIFLVSLPFQTLVLQKVKDGADVGRDVVKVIVVNIKVATTSGGNVVGLRGVSDSIGVVEEDTLLSNGLVDGQGSGSLEIIVLEPDLQEALENLSLSRRGSGASSSSSRAGRGGRRADGGRRVGGR